MLQYQVQFGPNSALAVSKMHVLKTGKLHFVGGGRLYREKIKYSVTSQQGLQNWRLRGFAPPQ